MSKTATPVASILTSFSRPTINRTYVCAPCLRVQQIRCRDVHNRPPKPIPQPTPFVPDVSTFLTLIGRELSTHASKFQTWESLFKLSSPQLKELGIEPARSRRYLLRWREKFRNGEYGIGGDFQHVTDGVGYVKLVDLPSASSKSDVNKDSIEASAESHVSVNSTPGFTKLILNVPSDTQTYQLAPGQTTADLRKPAYMTLKDGHIIRGSYLRPVKGSKGAAATLKVAEGLWEDKRGRKIFGGERRRAETLHKMRVAERKAAER